MLPRTSARLKERIENRPPATSQIVTKAASRPQKKKKSKGQAAVNVSPDTHSTKKSQPATYARVKGRKGKLRNMTEMPMDVLFEIFGRLEPVDLLHLSRATKSLRSILIAPNANFLWKMAYQNLHRPPPSCPKKVNLRHYTNFLYGRNCHFCASSYGTVLHYPTLVRLCRTCVPKHLIRWDDIRSKTNSTLKIKALDLCATAFITATGMNEYVLKIEYAQKLRALRAKKDVLELFYQKNLRMKRPQNSHIQHWYTHQQSEHAANREEFRRRRENAIAQRVRAEGYGSELDGFLISRLPGVKSKSTKELSDRDWERIKPRLIELLENERQKNSIAKMIAEFRRRIYQLSTVIIEFYYKAPRPLVIPPTAHFARTAPFVDLIKDTPVNQLVANSEFQDLASHIPGITASWRESADKRLLDLLPYKSTSRDRKGKGKKIGTSRLELATSFFKCHLCRESISYPRILMHRHRRGDDSEEQGSEVDTDEEVDSIESKGEDEGKYSPGRQVNVDSVWNKMSSWYRTEWDEDHHQVTFDDEASGSAQVIVAACGEDPDRVTSDRMNNIGARVECLRCAKKGRNRKRHNMNWITAILHDLDKHSEEAPDEKGWLINRPGWIGQGLGI